jgi:hypothetical protein
LFRNFILMTKINGNPSVLQWPWSVYDSAEVSNFQNGTLWIRKKTKRKMLMWFSNPQSFAQFDTSNSIFTFRIYEIYKVKIGFTPKFLKKKFLLKTCFLPIKSHKTWKKPIKKSDAWVGRVNTFIKLHTK